MRTTRTASSPRALLMDVSLDMNYLPKVPNAKLHDSALQSYKRDPDFRVPLSVNDLA